MREAAKRTLGQRHFDVQLMGGIVLHRGMIAEMKTGEGKTLVATLAVYLNALAGKGVHVVTVNDYLAQPRQRMDGADLPLPRPHRRLHRARARRSTSGAQAYAADVTYGTNNEFGFDYLRDNMKFRLEDMVQRPFNYAIVDEVDSILIDEARTPLIISGPAEDSSELYRQVDKLIPQLVARGLREGREAAHGDADRVRASRRSRQLLREAGLLKTGTLYDIHNVSLVHHANQALRAHKLFARDTDYIVKDDKVVIIDEFTGRMMEGRRYSEGPAPGARGQGSTSPIQNENQTLASITFQNYFRLYPEARRHDRHGDDRGDRVLRHLQARGHRGSDQRAGASASTTTTRSIAPTREKYDADPRRRSLECRARSQPVLVGTVSIEKSEALGRALQEAQDPAPRAERALPRAGSLYHRPGRPARRRHHRHQHGRPRHRHPARRQSRHAPAAGARRHRRPGGARGAAAPRSAPRSPPRAKRCVQAGGLFVIGSERHESRRIDNQLRGRSGRQGDPGASKFFVSLEDDLMRIFGSERMDGMLQKLGLKEGEAIIHPWINKALEKAQQKVEARNYEIRKHLLQFDDVMNDQRKVVYEQRREIMSAKDVGATIVDMRHEAIEAMVDRTIPANALPDQWDIDGAPRGMRAAPRASTCRSPTGPRRKASPTTRSASGSSRRPTPRWRRRRRITAPTSCAWPRSSLLLQLLDQTWKEHLLSLDHLRQGINLRAYAQRDPLNEYKREAFELFQDMLVGAARGGDQHALPRRAARPAPGGRAGAAAAAAARCIESREDPALAEAMRQDRAARGNGAATGRRRRGLALGAHPAQRALPLRLRQEIQALPR